MTLNCDLTHDLDPCFSMSNFEKVVTREWEAQLTGNKKGSESPECWTNVVSFNVDLTYDLDLEFSASNFEKAVSQEWEGRLTWNEKGTSRYDVLCRELVCITVKWT